MGKINMNRVLLGGLLAGLILNIGEYLLYEPILGAEWRAVMEGLGVTQSAGMMVYYILWGFVTGIALVWLYAAMRPRFGAGPKTAVITGLAVWFLMWLLGFGGFAINGMFPANLVFISLVWGFFEVPLATLAGAWVYKEEPVAAAA